MEEFLSQDFEILQGDSEYSFRSSKCSLQDLSKSEFLDLCKSRLKVSKSNIALLLKVK